MTTPITTSAYHAASTCGGELFVRRTIARQTMTRLASARIAASPSADEVLGLAVAVLVAHVGRPPGDADGEERQERGDEVGARVRRLGEEPEAVRREAGRELERDERRRREQSVRRCGLTPEA